MKTITTHLSQKSVHRRVPRGGVAIYDEHGTETVIRFRVKSLLQRPVVLDFEEGGA